MWCITTITSILGTIFYAIFGSMADIFLEVVHTPNKPLRDYEDKLIDQRQILGTKNTGIAIGTKQLSMKDSYEGTIAFAKPGGGKSTGVVIPTALLADKQCSLIITDFGAPALPLMGTALEQRLNKKVYNLNFADASVSEGWNFLTHLKNTDDEMLAAKELCRDLEGGGDKFWYLESLNFCMLLLRIMRYVDPKFKTPVNLFHIAAGFKDKQVGKILDSVVIASRDKELYNLYKSTLSISERTLSGIITSVKSVLGVWNSDSLKRISSHDTLGDLYHLLRRGEQPAALFLTHPVMSIKQYESPSNIFFSLLFERLLREMPHDTDRDVIILYDELGSARPPDTIIPFVSNCRKARISFCGLSQSSSQLRQTLGTSGSEAFLNSLGTKIIWPGSGWTEAAQASKDLGKFTWNDEESGRTGTREVLTATEVKYLQDGKVLVFNRNNPGTIADLVPYYKNRKLKKLTSLPSFTPGQRIPETEPPLLIFADQYSRA